MDRCNSPNMKHSLIPFNTKPNLLFDNYKFLTESGTVFLPVVALLTGEAFEVIYVGFGPHHHLEGGYDFVAGGAVTRRAE